MRTLRRALRAALFDRKVHSELFFDSDATADAVLLVAAVAAIDYIGRVAQVSLRAFSVTGLLEEAIYALVAWLILAGGTWLAATKLLQGSGQLQTMMRLHGHCELPLVLAAIGPLGATVGLIWSVAAKVPATSESSSLSLVRSVAAVLIGLALVVLVRLIFRLPFLALSGLF
ncbi:MAG: YIP1 family protein [Acidimicrobiia bacterium]